MAKEEKPKTVDRTMIADAIHLIAAGKADDAKPLIKAAEEIRQAAENNATREE